MKKIAMMIISVLMALTMLSGCGSKMEDDVAMTVEDTEVSVAEVNMYVYQLEQMYEAQYADYGDAIWDYGYGGQTVQEIVKQNAVDAAKMMNVIAVYASENNIVIDDETKTSIQTDAKDYFDTLEADVIDQKGLTLEVVEKFYTDNKLSELVMDNALADFTVDEARLEEQLAADSDYQLMMESGPEEYLKMVRARHILISTMDENNNPLDEAAQAAALEEAEEVLAKAKALENLDADERTAGFIELVSVYSADPGSKDTGGEYTFGRAEMVPEFENSAFSMEPGQISDLVETTYGYHILLLEEIIMPTAEEIASLEQYQEYVVENYKAVQKQEAFDALYAEWLSGYTIEMNDKALENVIVKSGMAEAAE